MATVCCDYILKGPDAWPGEGLISRTFMRPIYLHLGLLRTFCSPCQPVAFQYPGVHGTFSKGTLALCPWLLVPLHFKSYHHKHKL